MPDWDWTSLASPMGDSRVELTDSPLDTSFPFVLAFSYRSQYTNDVVGDQEAQEGGPIGLVEDGDVNLISFQIARILPLEPR